MGPERFATLVQRTAQDMVPFFAHFPVGVIRRASLQNSQTAGSTNSRARDPHPRAEQDYCDQVGEVEPRGSRKLLFHGGLIPLLLHGAIVVKVAKATGIWTLRATLGVSRKIGAEIARAMNDSNDLNRTRPPAIDNDETEHIPESVFSAHQLVVIVAKTWRAAKGSKGVEKRFVENFGGIGVVVGNFSKNFFEVIPRGRSEHKTSGHGLIEPFRRRLLMSVFSSANTSSPSSSSPRSACAAPCCNFAFSS